MSFPSSYIQLVTMTDYAAHAHHLQAMKFEEFGVKGSDAANVC